MSNIDLILNMYKHFGTGDLEKIRADLFDRDIIWRVPGHHPLAGEHRGGDQVLGFLGQIARTDMEFTDMHFGELDDGTVVEKHIAHARVGAESIVLPAAVTYGIRENKIADVRVHSGDQHALDRFIWAVVALRPVPQRLEEAKAV